MEHILAILSRRYPQLLFPIATGTSTSSEYKDAVCFGKNFHGSLDYSLCEKDWFRCVDTPAGSIDVLLLHDRRDFEKCACALANRCEPKTIPESVGAFMISGLINWEKVRKHLNKQPEDECFVNGFVWNWLKKNHCDYHDRIILLSSGWYSGITPEMIGLSDEEWSEKSVTTRLYHEITHFVCRSRSPKNIDVIRDEVFADMIGMVAAFGHYDANMAKLFLGIDGTKISGNARIRYYLKNHDENSVVKEILFWISWLENRLAERTEDDIGNIIVNTFDEMLDVAGAFDNPVCDLVSQNLGIRL